MVGRVKWLSKHFATLTTFLSPRNQFRQIHVVVRDERLSGVVVLTGIEQRIDEQLRIVEEGARRFGEEIDLRRMGVKDQERAFATKQGQSKYALIGEPKTPNIAVARGIVTAGIEEYLKDTLGAEFLIRQQIDQNLPAPAKQDAVDRAAMFQALKSRT